MSESDLLGKNKKVALAQSQAVSETTAIENDELANWLALLRAPGIGAATYKKLLTHFDSPRQIFSLPNTEITRKVNLRQNTLSYLRQPDWAAVEGDLRWAEQANNHIITLADPSYPALLSEINDPPPLLFATGDPTLLQYPQIAMVGSRNPNHSGAQTAHEFAKHLSVQGFVITSGLALGIDAASHRGALAGSGLTVAVAGTGLDRVYPAAHKELAHEIAEQGVLISENVPGTLPKANQFPRRNRIISGLSIGVLVVEAAKQSGSLITARLAMEQGREVFAIPGSIHSPLSRGCHYLIRQGAKLVETSEDILEECGPLLSSVMAKIPPVGKSTKSSKDSPENSSSPSLSSPVRSSLNNDQQSVINALGFEPTTIDQVVERCKMTIEAISAALVQLEIQGYIVSQGGLFCRSATHVSTAAVTESIATNIATSIATNPAMKRAKTDAVTKD